MSAFRGDTEAMSRFPCPCCGHLTLASGPGDYELCPVCFWEDDGAQLRFPMSSDGANGISLMEAQRVYARTGGMHRDFARKVRRPRADEPLDEGWRPFDPDLDWTAAALWGDQWPVNAETLYYWRSTYWNGDQHKLPRPVSEPTNQDRFMEHLRQQPELQEAIAESERRWGEANPFDVCEAASRLAVEAYRAGHDGVGLRIATALLPALNEESPTYAPNCVVVAFLDDERWHEPWVQQDVDHWPAPIRDELRSQQEHRRKHEVAQARSHEDWTDLFRSGRGQPVEDIVERLRALTGRYDDAHSELGRQVMARFISNHLWLYRHPVDSLLIAWRYRSARSPLRTLAQLRRPRFSG